MGKITRLPVIPFDLQTRYRDAVTRLAFAGRPGYQTRIGERGAPELSSALDNRYRRGPPKIGKAYRDTTAQPGNWYRDYEQILGGYKAPDPRNPAAPRHPYRTPQGKLVPPEKRPTSNPRERFHTPKGVTVPQNLDQAGTTIRESAMDAATWLALNWPKAAAAAGIDNFIAARYIEIMARNWNPTYWEQATPLETFAEVTVPTSIHDPVQASPGFYDPTKQRSKTTYGAAGQPYPLPATGTPMPAPSPGYKGAVSDNHFRDLYLASLLEDFSLPRDFSLSELPPVFASVTATWIVDADKTPTQIQFSARHRPVFQNIDDPDINDPQPIDIVGRFLNWTHKLPTGGALNYHATMTRAFLLDCNLSAAYKDAKTGSCSRLRLKQTCAAARGRYHSNSATISVQFSATSDVWMAKTSNDPGATPPKIINLSSEVMQSSSEFSAGIGDDTTTFHFIHRHQIDAFPTGANPGPHTVTVRSNLTGITRNMTGRTGDPEPTRRVIYESDDRIMVIYPRGPFISGGMPQENYFGWVWKEPADVWRAAPGEITKAEWARLWMASQ